MTIFKHEMKRNLLSLIIWSGAIAFLLATSVLIYPEMSKQMGDFNDLFANMGNFSAAFGMDQLNFGEFGGYFGVECGNTLGLGGAFFAAIIGISALAKEEKERTADFLLAHPISRVRVIAEKYLAVLVQIFVLNLAICAVVSLAVLIIGENPDMKPILLLLFAYLILQFEIATISFAISAFLKGNGLGIGLGIAFVFYFANILSNLTEEAKFLKYITPYGYSDGAYIITNSAIEWKYMAVGIGVTVVCAVLAFFKYSKKDIA